MTKRCSRCSADLPLSDFYRNRTRKDGLQAFCKTCAKAHAKAWVLANPDRAKQRERARYLADPQRRREALAAWKSANPQRVKEKERAWVKANRAILNQRERNKYAADPEQYRQRDKKWRDSHRELQNEKWHRRRARIKNAFVENVNILVLLERDNGICQLCFAPVLKTSTKRGDTPSIDHITPLIHGGEHSYANTQLAHFSCNSRKGASLTQAA